ncbi:MAG: c-type cytochrome biogenesis protein CcmI [Rhodospirillaceae bacterium]|nr:c-type cytochrome biogenesis protein CcmI [Rhodospirillaceae bacterium]
MMVWIGMGVLTIMVVAALVWPLVREQAPTANDTEHDLTVLRDQLAEVERDVARGVLSGAEAEALRVEIQRRILAAGRREAVTISRESPGLRAGLTAVIAVAVPMAALAVYGGLGSPQLPAKSASAPHGEDADPEMAKLVDQLAARMAGEPNNIEGWALLARSYRQIDRFAEALDAYRHLLTLNPPGAEPYANFGEMAVTVAGGVTEEAREAFLKALERDRADPRARFYLGLAEAHTGNARGAIAIWRELTASAPADAPWQEMVRGRMFQVAQSAAIMPMTVEPRHPLDPETPVAATPSAPEQTAAAVPPSDPNDITSPDVSAIKGQFSGENLAQIQAMVGSLAGRLENNPEDFNGWMMLGRSYAVLKNMDGAKGAFTRAVALKPQDLSAKIQLASVLMTGADLNSPAPLPEALARITADILALDANQPDALFISGIAKAKAGDADGARAAWQRARVNTNGTPLAAEIDRRLQALK